MSYAIVFTPSISISTNSKESKELFSIISDGFVASLYNTHLLLDSGFMVRIQALWSVFRIHGSRFDCLLSGVYKRLMVLGSGV
jgi:hypothetical protein